MVEKRKRDKEVSQFVDDLAGLLWHHRVIHHAHWKQIAADGGLCASTVMRLANRQTRSPMFNTVWQVLKALDRSSVIRHATLEKFRGISRPVKKESKKSKANA